MKPQETPFLQSPGELPPETSAAKKRYNVTQEFQGHWRVDSTPMESTLCPMLLGAPEVGMPLPIPQPSLAVACLASPCNGRGTIPCKDLQGCDVRGCSQVRRYGEERDSHSQAQG